MSLQMIHINWDFEPSSTNAKYHLQPLLVCVQYLYNALPLHTIYCDVLRCLATQAATSSGLLRNFCFCLPGWPTQYVEPRLTVS